MVNGPDDLPPAQFALDATPLGWDSVDWRTREQEVQRLRPSENINFFGAIEVDIEGELAQLGPTGYRPLRVRDTLF